MSVPADVRVWSECLAVKEAGFRVTVICPVGQTRDRSRFEVVDGVTIHRFQVVAATGGIRGYLAEYAVAFWRIRRLARSLARRHHFTVVHAANPPDFLLIATRFLKRRGASFIFDQHDLVPELYAARFGTRRRALYGLTRALERYSLGLADVVVVPNGSYRRVALTRGRRDPKDVFIVRNAPNPEVFRPVAPDPSLKRGKKHLVAYVGTMNAQDGVDQAIRALGLLRADRGDWHAIFAGDGDAVSSARQLAETLGIAQSVEFPGRLERAEVVRLLSTADVCLSPEPASPLNDLSTFIKIAEYMAMERPLVAFDLPESRVTAGEAALYAPPGDLETFAGRIGELLDDPGRRAAMGRSGRARILDEFSWEHSKPQLLSAYGALTNKMGRGDT
jgi:glycosyltransferase involved in cell wall biosynthesis